MSDPASMASKALAKVPGALDTLSGGALSDLKEQILPNVDALLRSKTDAAHDAMWTSVIFVARALVAGVHGVPNDHENVWRFINDAAADPAFAARTMRLLSAGLRSPSEKRRRMLALALFQPHADPDLRDQIDAAVEHLQPGDVELLRVLVADDADGTGYFVGALTRHEDPGGISGHQNIRSLGRTPEAHFRHLGSNPDSMQRCSVASLMRLQTAQCIDLGATGIESGMQGIGSARFWAQRRIDVLPLGRDLLTVLKDERAVADVEESAARGDR